MTQLELYKEALRLLRDSEVPSEYSSFRLEVFNYGFYYFSGLCELLTLICYENFIDDVALDIFKLHSEDILGKELNWKLFWFTSPFINQEVAKQERIQHLEKLIKLYENSSIRIS